MKYIVYLTTNLINNKIYVGVHETEDPTIFDGYIGNSINIFQSNPELKHPKIPFHKDIKKYGYKSFRRLNLAIFDTYNEAVNLEKLITQRFIDRTDTYNVEKQNREQTVNKRRKVGQYTMDGELVKVFDTLRECRKEFPNVSKVLRGQAKHCHNYTFKYLE